MKRKILCFAAVCHISIAAVCAQGMPVIDVSNLLETIYNGYQMYQQVQTSIQQLQYAYESTKAQLQQLQQLDYSSIGSFTDAVSVVDKHLSFLRRTEDRFKYMRIRIGDGSYSLAELYKIPGNAFNELADDLTREMTDYEKAVAWSHYGLQPANYFYAKKLGDRATDLAGTLAAMSETAQERATENSQTVSEALAASRSAESMLAGIQAQTEILSALYDMTVGLSTILATFTDYTQAIEMSNKPIYQPMQASSDFLK